MLITGSLLASCSHGGGKVNISAKHWSPGESQRFLVYAVDSGVYEDSSYAQERAHYQAILTVLDTLVGATIEWREFYPRDKGDDHTWPIFDVPSFRIVYRCTPDGRYGRIVNLDEVRAYEDTMITVYMKGAGMDSAQMEAMRRTFLDSSMIERTVGRDLRNLHMFFGISLSESDTLTSLIDWEGHAIGQQSYVKFVLERNGGCSDQNTISFRAWNDTDRVNASGYLSDALRPALDIADSTGKAIISGMGSASIGDDISICMDTAIGLPIYLHRLRSGNIGGNHIRSHLTIQRINNP